MAGPEQYSDSVKNRGMATTRVRLLSLPSDLIREAERLAKQEGRTKTEVLREALRRYGQEQRWRRLQRYGAGRARKVGMRQAGVVRAVPEVRRGRLRGAGWCRHPHLPLPLEFFLPC